MIDDGMKGVQQILSQLINSLLITYQKGNTHVVHSLVESHTFN